MARKIIQTDKAPQAIGTYSQAVQAGNTVYLSGQIPLVPETMELVEGDMEAQVRQVFANLRAVVEATAGSMADVVKITVYLTDLTHFPLVNQEMAEYFQKPYPARAAIGVAALPKGAAGFTTVELKSNFLGTARDGVIECRAEAQHLGRMTQLWDATVKARETGKTIALFRCTQMVLWPK